MRQLVVYMCAILLTVPFFLPMQAHAQLGNFFKGPLVPCGASNQLKVTNDGTKLCIEGECTTCGLVTLASNVINFMIFLAVVAAALLFAYAGGLYIFSAANQGNISKAHRIFWDVLLGLVLVLVGWMVVDTVMKVLYGDGPQDWGPWNQILCGDTAATTDCRPIEKNGTSGLSGTPPPPAAP